MPERSLIEDAFNNHLVYSFLDLDLIKLDHVLARLLESNPPTLSDLIVYRQVLLKIKGADHYVNGVHFLVKAHDQYRLIYHFSDCPAQIKVTPDQDPVPVKTYLETGLNLLKGGSRLEGIINLITGRLEGKLPLDNFSVLMFSCRCSNLVKAVGHTIPALEGNLAVFAALYDWFEQIEESYQPGDFTGIVLICENKKSTYPAYWDKIAPRYEAFFKKHQLAPGHDVPTRMKNLFPNFYPPITSTFTKTTWFIYQLPRHLSGYLLGYPIHLVEPTDDQITQALVKLSQDGIDKYTADLAEAHRKYYTNDLASLFGFAPTKTEIFSTQDTLGEDVFSYSPFDLLCLDMSKKKYFFTRVEFDNLVKTLKNHWTNTPLNEEECLLIESRRRMADLAKLPPALPLKEILDKLNTYTPLIDDSGHIILADSDQISQAAAWVSTLQELIQFF